MSHNLSDENEHIRAAHSRAIEMNLPPIDPAVTNILRVLASTVGAQAVVEAGTGTGISTVALLEGMTSSGVLTSIDHDGEIQHYAREMLTDLGFSTQRIRLITGRALEVMPRMTDRAYDIVFANCDQIEFPAILSQARRLLRERGLAVFNGVLAPEVLADSPRNKNAAGVKDLISLVSDTDEWSAALLTVGTGLLVATLRSVR